MYNDDRIAGLQVALMHWSIETQPLGHREEVNIWAALLPHPFSRYRGALPVKFPTLSSRVFQIFIYKKEPIEKH